MAFIDSFNGKNRYLSNFADIPVVFNGIEYDNSEAAFQAQNQLGTILMKVRDELK